MIKVAATYVISGFPHRIYSSDAKWGCITMTFMGERDAELRVTDEVDDSISENIYFTDLLVELEEIKRGFEFELQCKLTLGKKFQQFGDNQNHASSALAIGSFSAGFLSPRNPPPQPPKVKREHDRLIMVFVEASSFHDYQDEEFRRYCMIIEELESLSGELRHVRNFISHATITSKHSSEYIGSKLPCSIFNSEGHVRFIRNTTHRNFVGRYVPEARGRAKALILREMESSIPK